MRSLGFVCAALGLSLSVFAQSRSVAITVDDLPYAGGALAVANEASHAAEIVKSKLLDALQAHRVPATGFVIQRTWKLWGQLPAPVFSGNGRPGDSTSEITLTPIRISTTSLWRRLNRRSSRASTQPCGS